MKKTLFFLLAFLAPLAAIAADEVRVVYPSKAAEVELDSSTPAKRAEPPVRESNEFDPVTPIGQIRAVLDTLERLEQSQEETRAELKKATVEIDDDALLAKFSEESEKNVAKLFPAIEKNASAANKIVGDVATLLKATDGLGVKLDALVKTTENLKATVEAAQKTATSIERIRTSRWTDYAVLTILALILIQLVGKVGSFIATRITATQTRLTELSEAYALAKRELKKKQTKGTKATK